MKKIAACLVALGFTASIASADLIVDYTFGTLETPTTNANSVIANLSATPISTSGAITFGSFQATTWTGSGVPYGQANTGWGENNQTDAKFLGFIITASAGYTFSLTDISFLYRSTAAGPESIGYSINGSNITSFDRGSTLTVLHEGSLNLTGLTSAEVRIQGWVPAGGTSAGSGDFRFDDIQLFGSVIPEPGSLALLGVGAFMVFFLRRKSS